MSEGYEVIENWAPIVGRWLFPSPVDYVYASPLQAQNPFGICVSKSRFSEGDAKVLVQLLQANKDVGGRILLGYRSANDPYITIGIGGWGLRVQHRAVRSCARLASCRIVGKSRELGRSTSIPTKGSCTRTKANPRSGRHSGPGACSRDSYVARATRLIRVGDRQSRVQGRCRAYRARNRFCRNAVL